MGSWWSDTTWQLTTATSMPTSLRQCLYTYSAGMMRVDTQQIWRQIGWKGWSSFFWRRPHKGPDLWKASSVRHPLTYEFHRAAWLNLLQPSLLTPDRGSSLMMRNPSGNRSWINLYTHLEFAKWIPEGSKTHVWCTTLSFIYIARYYGNLSWVSQILRNNQAGGDFLGLKSP